MTLQASGAISLANVQTEFGGSNPIGINEYYAAAAGVPGSGTISLYDFYGKSAFSGWNEYSFGNRQVSGSQYTTTDNFSGNIITPGAGNSPQTFQIYGNGSGSATLYYYQGGSLNTTTSTINTAYAYFSTTLTATFGSSSMQFRSDVYDGSSYDDISSSTAVYRAGTILYAHLVNLTGSGNYPSDY
jgi:hypothetical protein